MKARALALLLALSSLAASADEAGRLRLVQGATRQVGVTVRYDGGYRRLAYPMGDVPLDRGACTDVLIRAYRDVGVDLQVLVHEDMSRSFASYPRLWGLVRPDRSIDHRRVPNLATFFRRKGESLPVSARAGDYAAADVVTWRLPSGLPHIGLVSDRKEGGRPLVVHNIGAGTVLEDMLFQYPITGHFRYLPPDR